MDQGLPLAKERTGHLFHMIATSYSTETRSDLHGDHFSPPAFASVTIAKGRPWDDGDSKLGRHLFLHDTRIDRQGFTFLYNPSINTYCLHTDENPFGAWLRVNERMVLPLGTKIKIKIGMDKLRAGVGDKMIDGFDYLNFDSSSFEIRAINSERYLHHLVLLKTRIPT